MAKPLLSAGLLIAVTLAAGCGDDDDDGSALASLDGTSWSLAEGKGVTVPIEFTMTVAFAGGTASGSSGCNRFTGAYEEVGRSVSFGPLATTRTACADEVMTAEHAYLAALESVSSWSATDAELPPRRHLDQPRTHLRRQPPPPLPRRQRDRQPNRHRQHHHLQRRPPHRRQQRLGRMVPRPHRRSPHLQPRPHTQRDPNRHDTTRRAVKALVETPLSRTRWFRTATRQSLSEWPGARVLMRSKAANLAASPS